MYWGLLVPQGSVTQNHSNFVGECRIFNFPHAPCFFFPEHVGIWVQLLLWSVSMYRCRFLGLKTISVFSLERRVSLWEQLARCEHADYETWQHSRCLLCRYTLYADSSPLSQAPGDLTACSRSTSLVGDTAVFKESFTSGAPFPKIYCDRTSAQWL